MNSTPKSPPSPPSTSSVSEKALAILGHVVGQHSNGEQRPQQKDMVLTIADAITSGKHSLIQAGTGVGKSLGYLIPLCASDKKVVVSTATNQLSEQLALIDLPFLSKVLEGAGHKKVRFSILKGRNNYVCLKKLQELKNLDHSPEAKEGTSLFSDKEISEISVNEDYTSKVQDSYSKVAQAKKRGKEVKSIVDWVDGNSNIVYGDKTEAPAVSEETWKTVSSTSSECPGSKGCPFSGECFAENARNKARSSDVVVTNHALVAMDLKSGGESILGNRDVFVFDELHELNNYLSSAWGTSLSKNSINDTSKALRGVASMVGEEKYDELLEQYKEYSEKILESASILEPQSISSMGDFPRLKDLLVGLNDILGKLDAIIRRKEDESGGSQELTAKLRIAIKHLDEIINAVQNLLEENPDQVKWIEKSENAKDPTERLLKTAPLRVGPPLMKALDANKSIMVGTSATITVGGKFEIPARNLSLGEEVSEGFTPREYIAKDVGTPFEYSKQAMLYIPKKGDFPEPIGADRLEHNAAVLDILAELVAATGGRTLALSTTTYGAKKMAERLRETVSTPVISHLDGPIGQVVEEFTNNETATLCATMGLWHGLNVPGRSLSLVVIDKIPFPPMDEPLMKARKEDADSRGLNGFMDVYVSTANVMLSQGFGRLIRHTADRGGVAILDPRLTSKAYGKAIVRSLPRAYTTHNQEEFISAMKRLRDSME